MARYEAGETLANIARTYDCSPPAISYIVSRSRARGAAPTPNALPPEPQLVKSYPTELSPRQPQRGEAPTNGPLVSNSLQNPPRLETEGGPDRAEGVAPGPSVPNDREERGDSNLARPSNPALMSSRSGEANSTLGLPHPRVHNAQSRTGAQSPRRDVFGTSAERAGPPSAQGLQSFGPSARQAANGAPLQLIPDPQISGDGGVFIDKVLRERVEADIAAFLTAFDAALAHDTLESRAGLREATDRLLRAGARTRIELERLEARVPLPSRNSDKQYEPAGRPR
jgi:hypothetical protein